MAQAKFSNVDEYGFQRPDDFDYHSYAVFMDSYFQTLAKRRKRWERYMVKNRDFSKSNDVLKRYIRKGIPSPQRCEVWMKTSFAWDNQNKQPELYSELLRQPFDKDIVETIKLDLPRTFPENIYFEEMKPELFKVLVAYAHYNKEIGYCQGLNYIAGLILIATRNEESTFWLLKEMVENIVPYYHTKTMSGLILDIEVLTELIRLKMPLVHNHITKLNLPWAVITTKWFICLFAEVLPIETVLRIWDCLFNEGNKIIFRVCLTLIKTHQDEILQSDDMASLVEVFREMVQDPQVIDCHQFMKSIFTIPGKLQKNQLEKIRAQINSRKQLIINRRKSIVKN